VTAFSLTPVIPGPDLLYGLPRESWVFDESIQPTSPHSPLPGGQIEFGVLFSERSNLVCLTLLGDSLLRFPLPLAELGRPTLVWAGA